MKTNIKKRAFALKIKAKEAAFAPLFILPLFLFTGAAGAVEMSEGDMAKIVQQHKGQLDACLTTCVRECKRKFNNLRDTGREGNCRRSSRRAMDACVAEIDAKKKAECTNEKCGQGECQSRLAEYNKYKGHLDTYRKSNEELAERQAKEQAEESASSGPGQDVESAIKQTRDKKKDMQLYTLLGGAATAFLTYKAISCCTATPSCPGCVPLGAAAVAAGVQTTSMFKQSQKMGELAHALCADDPSQCSPHEISTSSDNPFPNPGDNDGPLGDCMKDESLCPPAPCKQPGVDCSGTIGILNPTRPGGPSPGGLTGNTFEPPGGPKIKLSPEDAERLKDLLDEDGGFNYGALTPKEKQYIDKAMKKLNSQNKGFLAKHGSGAFGDSDAFGDEEEGAGGLEEDSNSPGKSLIAGFSGGESAAGPKAVARGTNSARKAKKNPLADQMKKMLDNLYGQGGSGAGKDSLKDKSVQFGSDIVGVAEDNIFMMAHRRHQALDKDNRFIQEAF